MDPWGSGFLFSAHSTLNTLLCDLERLTSSHCAWPGGATQALLCPVKRSSLTWCERVGANNPCGSLCFSFAVNIFPKILVVLKKIHTWAGAVAQR